MATIDQRYFRSDTVFVHRELAYFATCRLANAIPFSAREQLMSYRTRCESDIAVRDGNTEEFSARLFAYWDLVLDLSPGPRLLTTPMLAAALRESLHSADGILYQLLAYTIMPTHVHVLFSPIQAPHIPKVESILDALKVPVDWRAQRSLHLSGSLWNCDDHVRPLLSREAIERVLRYMRRDPVRAGLVTTMEQWSLRWEREARL